MKMTYKQGISFIIKSFNEEKNIADAIKSCLIFLKERKGEVLIVDSLSSDKTIEIARKFPVKIFQIKNSKDRTCSVGAFVGYKEIKFDLVYLLDGDMILDKRFILTAEKILRSDEKMGGISGIILNKNVESVLDQRYNKKIKESPKGKVNYLDGGGLYKSKVIEKIGYFTNPNLHSYEEADIGFKIKSLGFDLVKMDKIAAYHENYKGNSVHILFAKFKSGYFLGAGEILRYNLTNDNFWRFLNKLKLYIFILGWWFCLVNSYIFKIMTQFILFSFLGVLLLLLKKKSFSDLIVSLVSWNLTAISMVIGFIKPKKSIIRNIEYQKIK